MPRYLVERSFPGAASLTAAELQDIAAKCLSVLAELDFRAQWVVSYVAGDKLYCVYEAPDEDTVRNHGRGAGLPVDSVTPLRAVIGPGARGTKSTRVRARRGFGEAGSLDW